MQRNGDEWYEMNGQLLRGDKVDWAPGEPSFDGDCAVASKNLG